MKGMYRAVLALVVVAACGRDGAITEPSSPAALAPSGLNALGTDPVTGASIETNKDDYLPGEVVHLTGRGWAPGETVNLHMTEAPNTHADVDTNVVADASGEFSIHFYDVQPHDLGVTFTLTATGQTSGSVAVATFWDGEIQVEIAPAYYPSSVGSTRRFSVLIRQTNTTDTRCIKITVPYTATFVSVTSSKAGWTGSSASNVITVSSATQLNVTTDWVRVEVDAIPPATSNGDWVTKSYPAQNCTGGENTDDPVINIGLPQNWTYTADFRDAGGAVTPETGSAGAPRTYRLRLTNTSGSNGDKGILAIIALPPCFSSPTSVALSTNNPSKPFTFSVRGTVIRLTGGELDKDVNPDHYVQVQFTTTPQNGCGTVFSTAMWKSAEHNSSENDTFVGNHPTIALGAVDVATTTEVLASPSPSVFGQSATFTATVTPTSGPSATGTVNFYEFTGGQTCAAPGGATVLGSDGSAPFTYATSALSVGAHTITACYAPSAGWTSSFDDVSHTVNKANVLVTVSDNPTSSTFGQSVMFTATVAAVAPGAGTPTGTVTFYEFTGGETCVAPGAATGSSDASAPYEFTTSSLSVGSHTITACYGGDGNFNANSGTDTHSVDAIGTTTEVLSSPSPSVFGQSVTFTATVTPASGPAATGTVNFYEFTGIQSCASLGSAVALGTDATAPFTFATSSLSVGAHTITACYIANVGWSDSFDDVAHTVSKANSSVTVSDNPTTSVFGQSVTFTATLAAVAPGVGTPGGTVTFYEFTGGQTCVAPAGATGSTDNSAPYEFTTSSLNVGAHTITACYGGDGNFNASEGADAHTVSTANASVTVTDNPTSTEFGQSVTFTAALAAVAPGAGTPTGTVTFYEFGVGQTCAAPGGATGSADNTAPYQLTTSTLAVGAHTVTACYGGDANFNAAEGGDTHTVVAKSTSTTVAVAPGSQQYSDKVVFTATITPAVVSGSTQSGNVQFKVGGSNTGAAQTITCGATECTATLTYTITQQASPPTLAISAAFTSTNANFGNSASTTDATLTVTKEDATVYDASVAPNNILIGGSGSLTFKVRETNGSVATEKNPQGQKDDGLVAAGDISNAGVSVTAKGVLTNTTLTLNCGAPSSNNLAGYNEILTVTCTFGPVNTADTYDVDIDVTGNYYAGEGATLIQVTDPNAGFTTGGGWFWHDGIVGGDKVNFGFAAKSTQNKNKIVYQGSLLVIRHMANGDVIKIKSNVFEGYSIKNATQQAPCASATFSGKANYTVNGVSSGNFAFTGYGKDCGEPGTSDMFGVYHALSPNGAATTTVLANLVGSAKTLAGGNIQVPQPSGRK